MKIKLNLAILLSTASLLLLPNIDLFASELTQKKSKLELIEEDLENSRKDVLSSRQYSLNKDFSSEQLDVVIRPYQLSAEQSPDWWSEKQSYDMSFLLVKALNNYPGLNVSLEKTWEERILEKENLAINKIKPDTDKKKIIITPIV